MINNNIYNKPAFTGIKDTLKQKMYNITHMAEIERSKPDQIFICKGVDPETGEIIDQTLSRETVEKMYKYTPKFVYGFGLMMALGMPMKQYAVAQEKMAAIQEIPVNIATAREKSQEKEVIVWDPILPLPEKLAKATQNPNTPAGKFYQSLKDNKESLMADLGIDSVTYNNYANVALKITKEESAYGQSKKYKVYEAIEQYPEGSKALETIREILEGDGSLSIGMSRYKIANASDEAKALFDKYGITYENTNSNILNPEKSAIATMIRLVEIGEKDYPKYLNSVQKLKPDTSTVAAKKSIENAQNLLFNNLVRPDALEILTMENDTPYEAEMLDFYGLTQTDLDDLRFYASTIELSKDAYLAARWNGKALLPTGARKDIACKNLLNIAAQKGYVSNIDKTSKVIY